MERTLLFGLALATVFPAFAQPTLNFPGNAPTPGTSFLTKYGEFRAAGSPGAGQTWDFGNLVADSSAVVTVVLPSATPAGGDYPNATAAVVAPDGTDYFNASSNILELEGLSIFGQTVPLTNSASYLPFPCNFQSSWEDDIGGTLDFQGFPLEVTGSVIGIADGYGTLVLPEGPVSDVLRVRRVTSTAIASPFGNFELEDETYSFYKAGVGLPILEISNTNGDLLGSPVEIQTLQWIDLTSVGMEDLAQHNANLMLWPNPTAERVSILMDGYLGQRLLIETFDAQGRLLNSAPASTTGTGARLQEVDLQGLPPGMYMLRVQDEQGRVLTGRVQKL